MGRPRRAYPDPKGFYDKWRKKPENKGRPVIEFNDDLIKFIRSYGKDVERWIGEQTVPEDIVMVSDIDRKKTIDGLNEEGGKLWEFGWKYDYHYVRRWKENLTKYLNRAYPEKTSVYLINQPEDDKIYVFAKKRSLEIGNKK